MNTPPALVLLGVSGSGKDTLCRLLQQNHPNKTIVNCKFSAFTKGLVANALQVPVVALEDKQWRTQPIDEELGSLSALDLLNCLFAATEVETEATKALKEANVVYTLRQASRANADLVVFTDVRRANEASAVVKAFANTTFVKLTRPGASVGAADNNLPYLCQKYNAAYLDNTGTLQDLYRSFKALALVLPN